MGQLTGYRFDAQGKAIPLTDKEIWALPARPTEKVWVDVQGADPDVFSILSKVFQFHTLAIDDCLSVAHHPKIDHFEDYLFVIFRSIDFNFQKGSHRTTKLACFLGANFLVTFHRSKMPAIEHVRERLCQDSRVGARGVDWILHGILDRMVDLFMPELEECEASIEKIQEEVFEKPTPAALQKILKLKKDVMHMRRFAAPQRDVLNRLSHAESHYIHASNAIYFRDIYDHSYRISDTVDALRDMLMSLMETYLSMVSNKLNEIMKVLTLITTIMMPLTFIAGVYGMNLKMPEYQSDYGYPAVLVLMCVVGFGMYFWFRRKGWF